MKATGHIISALPLGAALYLATKSPACALVGCAAAVLVDTDHLLDYLIITKRLDTPRKIMESYKTLQILHKNYFLFHAWEWAALLLLLLALFPLLLLASFVAGYLTHMIIDQIYNTQFLGKFNLKNLFYFFLYRLKYGFDVPSLRKNGHLLAVDERIY